jgi:hypothetical protein
MLDIEVADVHLGRQLLRSPLISSPASYPESGSVMVNDITTCQPNERKDRNPVFMTCDIWLQQAEHIAGSLRRGTRVMVEGRLPRARTPAPNTTPLMAHQR